jgi:hypothetical protein
MPITKPTAEDVPKRALPFLDGVERGYNVDIRTPLFDGRDRQEVADQWKLVLSKHAPVMALELWNIEMEQLEKIGPVSRRKPFRDRIETIDAYYAHRDEPELSYSDLRGMEYANGTSNSSEGSSRMVVPFERLRPITHEQAAYQLPLNTNSGLPFFRRRGEVLRESINLAKQRKYYPAMLGWRGSSGQTGDKYGKQRVVFMVSQVTNIQEARYGIVVLPIYVNHPQFFSALISMEAVDREVTYMLDHLPDNAVMIGTDYSGYDQTNRTQQSWFFHDLRTMFQFKYHEELIDLQEAVRHMELVCTRDVKLIGPHGWPSGSWFTLIANSHINRLVQMSSPVVCGSCFQIQGDDGSGRVFHVERHLRHLEMCGFDVNPVKQFISSEATVYLQRLHHQQHRSSDGICHGIYPTMRALNSLLGQERFHRQWNSKMESLRTLAILNNTQWHPLFTHFCDFTVKFGDKYLKEFVDSLSDRYFRQRMIDEARAIPGFFPTYNQQDTLDGVGDFQSTRYIRNL